MQRISHHRHGRHHEEVSLTPVRFSLSRLDSQLLRPVHGDPVGRAQDGGQHSTIETRPRIIEDAGGDGS